MMYRVVRSSELGDNRTAEVHVDEDPTGVTDPGDPRNGPSSESCVICKALPGQPCVSAASGSTMHDFHNLRYLAYYERYGWNG